MAAGLGFKDFTTGEVLTAADVDGYLMQGVWVFASAAARDAAVTSPQEGNFAYLKDTNVTTYYTGSAWANLDTTGMTNPMTTTGDTIYSSSGSTPARLGIGSTGQVLTVAGGLPSWATPATPSSGANWSLLNSGGTTLSGTSTSVSGISGADKIMIILEQASTSGASSSVDIRVNGSTSAIYNYVGLQLDAPGSYSPGGVFSDIRAFGNAQGIPVGKMSSSASSRVTAGLTMTGANSSGVKAFQSVGAANPFGSNDAIMYILQGWFDTSSTISSVDIISQGSSFDAGKVYIYTSA
jgi:hypothetical protein